jgi:hypothetical protein
MELNNNNENNLNKRIKRLNIIYSLNSRFLTCCYPRALKPIRVIHFHPLGNKQNGRPLNPIDFLFMEKMNLMLF